MWVSRKVTLNQVNHSEETSQETEVEEWLEEKTVVVQVSRGSEQKWSDQNWAEYVLRVTVNWLWLRVIVKEGVNKSNNPIQNTSY
jgi:hypothetical protein